MASKCSGSKASSRAVATFSQMTFEFSKVEPISVKRTANVDPHSYHPTLSVSRVEDEMAEATCRITFSPELLWKRGRALSNRSMKGRVDRSVLFLSKPNM